MKTLLLIVFAFIGAAVISVVFALWITGELISARVSAIKDYWHRKV